MEACAVCPHQSDCHKVSSCLDDLNARYCEEHPNQFPRMMTPAQANSAMASLRSGRTLRRFTNGGKFGKAIVSRTKLRNHCAQYSEWGREVGRFAKANEKAADKMKSPKLYMKLCKYGHPLDAGRVYFRYGYECRRCLKCDKLRNARAGVLKPGDIEKVSIALRNGVTISQIIHGTPIGGGPRNPSLILVNTVAFYRFRHENPEFNGFVLAAIDKRIGTSVNPVLAVLGPSNTNGTQLIIN
jgi:hypothetical protein